MVHYDTRRRRRHILAAFYAVLHFHYLISARAQNYVAKKEKPTQLKVGVDRAENASVVFGQNF